MGGGWCCRGGLCPACTVPNGKCLGTKTNDVRCTGAASTICDHGEMIIVAKVGGRRVAAVQRSLPEVCLYFDRFPRKTAVFVGRGWFTSSRADRITSYAVYTLTQSHPKRILCTEWLNVNTAWKRKFNGENKRE